MTFESGEVLQTSTSVITEADKAVLYLTINIQGRLPFGNEMFMLDAFKERFVYPHYFLVQILYTKHYHCACVKKTQSYLISVFILLHYPQFSSCLVLSCLTLLLIFLSVSCNRVTSNCWVFPCQPLSSTRNRFVTVLNT